MHRALVFPKGNWRFQRGRFDERRCFEARDGDSRSGNQSGDQGCTSEGHLRGGINTLNAFSSESEDVPFI